MNNLKTEIEQNKILIFIVSNEGYNTKIIEIMKNAPFDKKTCYVSLNKPYKTITSNLTSNKINTNNLIFIDAITKGGKKEEENKNVIFTSPPTSLTELNIIINGVLESGKIEILFFDSLSTLLIYEKPETVTKFIHSLSAKLRALNINSIFIVLKDDITPELLKNLYMFADKVVDLDEEKPSKD